MNRRLVSWTLLLLGFAIWFVSQGLISWVGFAFALVGVSRVWPDVERGHDRLREGEWVLGPWRVSRRWLMEEVLPPFVLVAAIFYAFWPLVLGYMPISGDHPMHLFKAWIMWEQLLPDGQIMGWSHHFHVGYPANTLYPPGVDLWVCLYRALTLGGFSWQATYAHAFLAAMLFSGLTVYWAGRVLLGRVAGLIGAFLWIFDQGGFNEGGWSFAVGYGVWGQTLALAFGTWALIAFYRIVRGEAGFRQLLLAIGGASAAALTHPNGVLMMAVCIPLVFLVGICLVEKARGRAAIYLLGWGVAVVAMTAFFYLPLLEFGDYLYNLAVAPRTTAVMAERSLDGAVFHRTMGLAVFFGLLGGLIAVVRRDHGGVTLLVLAVVCVALSTSTVILALGVLDISGEMGRLDLRRFLFIAKLPVFLLAGFGLMEVGRWLRRSGQVGGAYSPVTLFVVGLCVAPMAIPFFEALGHSNGKPVETIRDHEDWPALHRFVNWAEDLPDDGFYRIAYLDDDNEHFLLTGAAFVGKPAFKIGFSPVDSFRYRSVSRPDARAQRWVGVRYLVTRSKRLKRRGGYRLVAEFQGERKDLPPLYVFERKGEAYRPYQVKGKADVALQSFEREEVRFQVTQAEEGAKLTLLVAEFPGWRATVNGREIPIESIPYGQGMDVAFMSVPLEPGEWVFSYGPTPLQAGTGIVGIIGWCLWFLALLAGFVPWVRRKATLQGARAWERVGRPLKWAASAVIGLVAIGLVVLLARGGPSDVRGTTPVWNFHDHVHEAIVWLEDEKSGQKVPCDEWSLNRWMCSRKATKQRMHVGPRVGNIDGLRPCIYAHPMDDKILNIQFEDVPVEDVLIGWHDVLGAKKGTPVSLVVTIDGEEIGEATKGDSGSREIEFDTSKWSGKRASVRFSVRSDSDKRRDYCFQIFSAER